MSKTLAEALTAAASGNVKTDLAGRRVVIIGASSPLGTSIANAALNCGAVVVAVSRTPTAPPDAKGIWSALRLDFHSAGAFQMLALTPGDLLISSAPLRVFASAIRMWKLPSSVAVTAISSASATTKARSPFPRDAQWSSEMREAESVIARASSGNLRILRPTMIYGSGRDKNVAHLAQLLAKTHILPLVGGGVGLRAPVHVDDLAHAVLAVAAAEPTSNPIHVPGPEQLTFRKMVRRIAASAQIRYAEIPVPALPFRLGGRIFANVGRLGWSLAACARMAEDLTVYDDASKLGIHRRSFQPDARAVGRMEPNA